MGERHYQNKPWRLVWERQPGTAGRALHDVRYERESFRRWPNVMPEGHLLAFRDDALRRGLV